MTDKAIRLFEGAFVSLSARREENTAILEFELPEMGRVAIAITQAGLCSLHQHIYAEGTAGHLSFELLTKE